MTLIKIHVFLDVNPRRVVNNTDVSDDHSAPVFTVKQDCSTRWTLSEDLSIQ